MNRKSLLALAVVALTSGAAFAEDIRLQSMPFVSTATRAQVQAELAAYRQAGVNPWSIRYNPLAQFRSQRTRAEVTAEYLAERDRVAAFTSEDSGSAWLAARRHQRSADTLAGQPARAQ